MDRRTLVAIVLIIGAGSIYVLNRPKKTPEPNTAQLVGTVVDDSGNPLRGVLIVVGSLSTKTNSEGDYELEVLFGSYTIEAIYQKGIYSKGSESLSVTESTVYRLDFTLELITS